MTRYQRHIIIHPNPRNPVRAILECISERCLDGSGELRAESSEVFAEVVGEERERVPDVVPFFGCGGEEAVEVHVVADFAFGGVGACGW